MTGLTKSTKSISAKAIKRSWHLFDLKGKILGREMTKIATVLQGKNKVDYVSYLDQGDYAVVVNAGDVKISGLKSSTKEYMRYSGYPGGLKKVSYRELLENKPDQLVRHAVSGMLPKNKHRDPRLARLFVFKDEKHPYENKLKS